MFFNTSICVNTTARQNMLEKSTLNGTFVLNKTVEGQDLLTNTNPISPKNLIIMSTNENKMSNNSENIIPGRFFFPLI